MLDTVQWMKIMNKSGYCFRHHPYQAASLIVDCYRESTQGSFLLSLKKDQNIHSVKIPFRNLLETGESH